MVPTAIRTTPLQAENAPGPWPHRLAWLAALAAVPLVLFGGSVTTLGAGMAVDGWLVAEGHFLLFFPVDQWLRDTATFVEHTHRLFGVLVGMFALTSALATLVRERRRGARLVAVAALLAVCLQGTLGGMRVLADDANLAFLHGALAQAVFALLCVNAAVLSSGWRAACSQGAEVESERRALESAASLALLVTCVQVVLGAWYRHGIRPGHAGDVGLRLALHVAGAIAALIALAALARRGSALRERAPSLPVGLHRVLARLPVLLVVQLVLGGLAWAGHREGALGPAEWALSIAHVLLGALLLAHCALAAAWTRRLGRAPGLLEPVPTLCEAAP
jgi:cytochrome c oxidase assembly protein subunit 15